MRTDRKIISYVILLFSSLLCQAQQRDSVETLQAASISARRERMRLPQMGMQTLNAAEIARVPAFMGERDLVKVLQMMPGVQAPSEGSTGFSVRGGLIDQNLILLDGAPLYNVGHFLGFFSMFNADMVTGVDLYKSDFPSRYGGRMSSVLDAYTKDVALDSLQGNISIGLISSKAMLEAPLVPGRLGVSVSARRSYLDAAFPLIKQVPKGSVLRFYDVNAKLGWVLSARDRVAVSAFTGADAFGGSLPQYGMRKLRFDYRNSLASLRWDHTFSESLFLHSTVYASEYEFGLVCDYNYAVFDYESGITEYGLKSGMTWLIDGSNRLEAGVQLPYVTINGGECLPQHGNVTIREMHFPRSNALQPNIYLENRTDLTWGSLRYGLRLSGYVSIGETDQYYYDPATHEPAGVVYYRPGEVIQSYWGLEPRVSAAVPLGGGRVLKASYSRTRQFFQQALVSTSGSPLDVWIAASPNVRPQVSDQFCLGIEESWLGGVLQGYAELFYKDNKNTLDFVEGTGVVIQRLDREGQLRFGRSFAYGAELMLRYGFERVNGWIGYTFSKAMYDIPEINGGRPYASPVNHENTVNVLLTYNLSRRISASACWVYCSGAPTTLPVGRFAVGGSYAPLFGARNADRLPDYHRLDLSLTLLSARTLRGKRWGGEWNFSVYNAYSRHNAWTLAYSYSQRSDTPRVTKMYLFPILPSLSYTIHF